MGQINYVLSIMFISLFTIAIIGFAVNFAIDNDAAIDIRDDPNITKLRTDTESSLLDMRAGTEGSYESIVESSVDQGETLQSGGVFSITITSIFPVMYNILNVGFKKIFGGGSGFAIFLTAFISIMGFLGFMYFVKTWLGRNPD